MKSNTIVSLTVVLALLIAPNNAAPIVNKSVRLSRRDDSPAACPGTLRGPSGNAYFAFSTNLNHQVAQEACASCYGGGLADVAVADLQFLASGVQQYSWIKSWNGDVYSDSCLTFNPSGGSAPAVGVDASCQQELWPLCVASSNGAAGPDGSVKFEGMEGDDGSSITTLAVPFPMGSSPEAPNTVTNSEAPVVAPEGNNPNPDVQVVEDEKTTEKTVSENGEDAIAVAEDSAAPSLSEVTSPRHDEVTATILEDNVQPDSTVPLNPEVTSPRSPKGEEGPDMDVEVVEMAGDLPVPAASEEPAPTDNNAPEAPAATEPAPTDDNVLATEPAPTGDNIPAATEPAPTGENVLAATEPAPTGDNVPATTEPTPAGDNTPVANEPTPAAEDAPVAEEQVPAAEEPVAEEPAPTVESTPVAAEPAPAMVPVTGEGMKDQDQDQDALLTEKEQFRAAFEEESEACSNNLAKGEQDPLVNVYMIEKSAHTASCDAHSHDDEPDAPTAV
ncbi:hypothetical protein BGZ58_004358 [Dissophora ornata]|nr:hypothetical protein BGZ58_004358 [Dissophora ornata]